MNKKEILDGNQLIAEFMGLQKVNLGVPGIYYYKILGKAFIQPSSLKYHSSWDHIMPVWDKFNKLGLIHFKNIEDRKQYSFSRQGIENQITRVDIMATFVCLCFAINWYNELPNNTMGSSDYEALHLNK